MSADADDRPADEADRRTGDEPADDRSGTSTPRFRVRPVVKPRPERRQRAVSRDETDEGWGDGPTRRDDDWYLREKPPHHG